MLCCVLLCMYVCMHVCMYACMLYACMHVCMYVCMHVCMYVYLYICMYMYIYVYVCVLTVRPARFDSKPAVSSSLPDWRIVVTHCIPQTQRVSSELQFPTKSGNSKFNSSDLATRKPRHQDRQFPGDLLRQSCVFDSRYSWIMWLRQSNPPMGLTSVVPAGSNFCRSR